MEHDIFRDGKKRCAVCGCHMYDDTDLDICDVCLDDLLGDPENNE